MTLRIDPILAERVFGRFFGQAPTDQDRVLRYLTAAWRAQYHTEPRTLSVDLELLAELYAPAVQAKKLRSMAGELAPVRERPHVGPELYVPVDSERGFVTPEGRILLEIMRSTATGVDRFEDLLGRLLSFYAEPRRAWMAKTFVGGDLRPATIGFVVFLLINGSVGEQRALQIPSATPEEGQLAAAVIPVVNAFSEGIGGSPLTGAELTRLSSNWAVTESNRQLPALIRPKRLGTRIGSIHIEEGKETDTIDHLGAALARRRGLHPRDVEDALISTTEAYLDHRALLKSWGLSWERPQHTRAVCQRIIDVMWSNPGGGR